MQRPEEQLPYHLPPDHNGQADGQHLRPCAFAPFPPPSATRHDARPPTDSPGSQDTLTYGCVCSDGKQPNISEYTLTLPYHVCTAWGTQCVASCKSDNVCASSCRQDHPCGAQSPTRVNETTSTSATASATASPSSTNQVFDGLSDGNQNGNSNTKNAAGALRFGDSFGLVVVAGGLFAGFAVLL